MRDLGFEVTGFLFFLLEVFFPLFFMLAVFFKALRDGFGIGVRLQHEQVNVRVCEIGTDTLGLIEIPLVASAGLSQDRLCVGAMSEDRDHGDQDGKDGNGERDSGEGFGAFAGFFELVGEFLDFGGFHGGDDSSLCCGEGV